jgi:glycosyltransferase involved in cell wall biosynthesis
MSRWHSTLYRLGLRAADAILVQNQAQLESLARNFGRTGRLLQNGYAEPAARPGRFEGHVLWAATVKPLKRPDLFIELARRLPALRFVMVGGPGLTPDARAFFDAAMRDAATVPNLQAVGHVPFDEVGRWFDGAALVVNTSDYEGCPTPSCRPGCVARRHCRSSGRSPRPASAARSPAPTWGRWPTRRSG